MGANPGLRRPAAWNEAKVSIRRHVAFWPAITCAAGIIVLSAPGFAAEPNSTPSLPGQSLTDHWAFLKQAMADAGVNLRFEWSQAYQHMVVGDGDDDSAYGGKLDALVRLDLSKLGLWEGFSVTAQGMYNYGDFLNGAGGVLTPIYDAAIYPGETGDDRLDLMSLYFTQRFSNGVSVTAGKINLMEAARGYPIRGGGGLDMFWNVNLSTTITGLARPAIFGAMLNVPVGRVSYGLSVFDARDAMNRDVFDDPFSEGVTAMATATLKTAVFGRTGYYGIRGIWSNKEGFDLNDLDQIGVPPEARDLNTKKGSWLYSAQFEQYLVRDEGGPTPGWGVFGEFVLTDGNPQAFRWSGQLGLAGYGLFPGRPQDRFGVAAFRFGLSENLKDGLAPLVDLNDESGIEVFYNWAVTPSFRLTTDLQFIDPGKGAFGDAIFAGIGTTLRF